MFNVRQSVVYNIGDVSAGTGIQYPVFTSSHTIMIKKVYILNDADLSKDGTNYTTLSLMNDTTTVASKATKTNDITANSPFELTLSTTTSDLKVEAGDVLEFKKADSGSGAALTDAVLVIEYEVGYP